MGLIFDILNILSGDDKSKKTQDKIFEDEADAFGLTENERKEAKQSGITPEEWAKEAHDAGLYDD